MIIPKYNVQMAPYFVIKNTSLKLNSSKTKNLLYLAGNILQHKAKNQNQFLFIGTNKSTNQLLKDEALRCKNFYVTSYWFNGMLTNWNTFRKRIKNLKDLEKSRDLGYFKYLTKKEISQKLNKINKLNHNFQGVKNLLNRPNLVIFLDPIKDNLALQECLKLGILTIVLAPIEFNPLLSSYIIPIEQQSMFHISKILVYLTNKIIYGYNKN